MDRLLTKKSLCTGCRACEVACVVQHEGYFGTHQSRIKITKMDSEGLDVPNICRLCAHPACVSSCPTRAIHQDEETGTIRLNKKDCFGCADCVDGCPFGVVMLNPQSGYPLICDLCDGDPACVKRCAPGAILFGERNALAQAKRESLAQSGKRRGKKVD